MENFEFLSNNFYKLCRLCLQLTNNESKDFNTFFRSNKKDFKKLIQMELPPDEEYPNLICSSCLSLYTDLFQKVSNLREQCLVSHQKLLEIKLRYKLIKEEQVDDPTPTVELNLKKCLVDDDTPNEAASHKGSTKKGRQCNYCGKFVKVLSSHILIHTQERPFLCQYCPKNFTTRSNKLSHEKIHLDIRNYKCTICPKTFVSNTSLRKHLLYHAGTKEFGCHLCDKFFNQRDQLRSHLLTHSQKKNYACDICDRKFFLPFNLRDHIKRAHSEKPKCDQCDKVFKTQSYLEIHKRRHSGDTPYQCSQCSRKFATGSAYSSHLKSHSRKEAPQPESNETSRQRVMEQEIVTS